MHIQQPKLLFWKIVLVSLVAHGLVLQLPWYSRPSVADRELPDEAQVAAEGLEEEGAIAISTLPISPSPVASPPVSPPLKPQIPPSQAPVYPSALPPPTAAPPAQPTQPVGQSQPVQPPVQPPSSVPDSANEPPPQTPPPEQPTALTPEGGMVVQLGESFPHLSGAQSGCYNLESCHRITGAGTYRQSAKKLVEQMQQQGYQVNERDDIESQGHRVFAVVPPDEPDKTYYLNVFSDSSDSTVYAITLEIVSLADLQQLSGQAAL